MAKPLKTILPISSQGAFSAERKFDIHTGVDLYCNDGDEVFAIEDGIVKGLGLFTGGVETPWWNDTNYVGVLGKSGYIVYGEIVSNLVLNSVVKENDLIGKVKRVLKKDKGLPTSMLHLELYSEVIEEPCVWLKDKPKPDFLLDPTFLTLNM